MKKAYIIFLTGLLLCLTGNAAIAGNYSHNKHASAKMHMMMKKPSFHLKMKQKHSPYKWHKKKHWHHHKPHGHGQDKPSPS